MYYQGDYYQGDYYQGDPFFGALIGGAVSWLGKKIFKRGLSKPAQIAAGTSIIRKGTRALPGAVGGAAVGAVLPSVPGPGRFTVDPGAVFPGGRPFITRAPAPGRPPAQLGPGAGCPSGYHLAKDGSGRMVRNRSMNVANPRALRRSLRRVAGFGKLAQRSKKDIRRAAKAIGA